MMSAEALDSDLMDELDELTLGNKVVSAMAHAMRADGMSAEQAADAWQRGKLTPVPEPVPLSAPQDASDRELAAQYEAYPYPARDPREEQKRLVIGSPSHLLEIDHWVFGARRPRSRMLRVLVAGCGTGDGAIMLAQHLASAGRPGEVLCIDRSERALGDRPGASGGEGLGNIGFRQESLLDLHSLDLGAVRLHRLLRRAASFAGPGPDPLRPGSVAGRRAAASG